MDLHAYTNRNTIFYFGLSLPALLMEGLFISIIAQASFGLPQMAQYIQMVPWLLLAASVFAIATFRPSLLLTLLIVSYFVSSILGSSASISTAGYLLGGEIAVLVIVASFSSLIGFGYSRAAKIEKQKPIISSSGPLRYQTISFALELLLPALVAVALVFATVKVVAALASETQTFPQPISGIFSSFVISPIVTIIIAAVTLAVVRDIIEPWILYYTITKEDAVSIMVKEATTMSGVQRSRRRVIFGAMLLVAIVVAGFVFAARYLGMNRLGSGMSIALRTLASNVRPVFGLAKPTPQPNLWVAINSYYVELENMINTLIHLLWGCV